MLTKENFTMEHTRYSRLSKIRKFDPLAFAYVVKTMQVLGEIE